MRITTSYQYDAYTSAIDQAQTRISQTAAIISSGKRINTPSDDPYGTVSVLKMETVQANLSQYASNLQTAKGVLSTSDNALNSVGSLVNSAYTLALSGANATTDPAALQGMADQITAIQSQLLSYANTQGPNGQYIFGGQKNATPPYAVNAGALVYSGDTNAITMKVGPNDTMAATTDASSLLTTAYSQLETLKNDLLGGNPGVISGTDVGNMKALVANVAQMRGDIGARLNTVSNLTSDNQRRTLDLTTNISNVQDADIAAAETNYTAATTAYQAALSVANAGLHLNIMDYLKV